MANKDLRDWLAAVKSAGQLKTISGAEPKEEIGGFVDIYQRKMGNPALLFDGVPGFPQGHRVVANILTAVPRINVALGLPAQASEMELIQFWRNYMKHAQAFEPRPVNGGPLLDNVFTGNDIDIGKIPTPVWHEHDGGPYIGTGCMVAMRDPDFRLAQLRLLSHSEPRARPRLGDDVARQARPHHHGQVSRPRPALPGGCRRRHAPGVFDARGTRKFPTAKTRWRPPAAFSASRSKCSTCRRPDCRCRPMPR